MSEDAALLFANEAFYLAFDGRDLAAMERIWAEREPIVCIHPGWQALSTRAAVMRSWRGILGNPEAPRIACRLPRAYLLGEIGFVVCYEAVAGAVLIATNVFRREAGAWKLVHHHAGPCPNPPERLSEPEPPERMQ